MKRFAYLFSIAALALGFGACNQHSWDEPKGDQPATKDVFKGHHGGEDKDHGGKKGEKHDGKEKKSEG